jgi:hypothetical protein
MTPCLSTTYHTTATIVGRHGVYLFVARESTWSRLLCQCDKENHNYWSRKRELTKRRLGVTTNHEPTMNVASSELIRVTSPGKSG